MRRCSSTLALLLLVPALHLRAQQARPAADSSWPTTLGCAIAPDTARLRISLPLDVLDRLQAMSGSAFVHAFLLQLVADTSSGGHRVSRCAREFINWPAGNIRDLRRNLPAASEIIDALRTAELTRQRLTQVADSASKISALITRLGNDPSAANMDVLGTVCRTPGTVCDLVVPMLRRADTLRLARVALARETDHARQTSAALTQLASQMQATVQKLVADSAVLRQLVAATPADSGAVRDATGRIGQGQQVFDAMRARRDTLAHQDTLEAAARLAAADSVTRASRVLDSAVVAVERQLNALPRLKLEVANIGAGSKIANNPSEISAVPALTGAPNTTVPPANVMLQLTDFIIARGKRELVNTFVVNLHAAIVGKPLLQAAFPETWGLMSGIGTRMDGALNAVDVGRIPLNTWRATLSGDFVSLPMNLVERGGLTVCGESVVPDAKRRGECRRRIAMFAPIAPFARRLVQGGTVLDILRDAPTFVPPEATGIADEWSRISQGLSVIAVLADAFAAQGSVPISDVTRHPYILTATSIAQVRPEQRAAFLRLLVVRAVSSAREMPVVIREAELYGAISSGSRAFDRIVALSTTEDQRGRTLQLVRASFEAFDVSLDVARSLTDARGTLTLKEVQRRWHELSGAVDPIVAGDFGLALSRSTVMLRDVLDGEIPNSVLTLAALGSSLSDAHSGDEVRLAFENAASPVGGWQSKRYGEGGISITAFPGIGTGAEMVLKHKGDAPEIGSPAATLGVALPIGIEWTLTRRGATTTSIPNCHWVCGKGFFFPIVDLGALLSYRVAGPGDVSPEPNTTFQQVFAPGVYYSMAFTRRLPLNLLLGGQLMPSLRKIDEASGQQKRSAVRFGAGLGMDLLLFGF